MLQVIVRNLIPSVKLTCPYLISHYSGKPSFREYTESSINPFWWRTSPSIDIVRREMKVFDILLKYYQQLNTRGRRVLTFFFSIYVGRNGERYLGSNTRYHYSIHLIPLNIFNHDDVTHFMSLNSRYPRLSLK